jgi:biotin carboxyl carrier protein
MITATSASGEEFKVSWNDSQNGELNGKSFEWDLITNPDGSLHVLHENKSYSLEVVSIKRDEKLVTVKVNGEAFTFEMKDRFDDLLEQLGMDMGAGMAELQVKAPMPGLVLEIMVKEGQEVSEGEPLLILEAMKMENVIKAAADAVVASVKVSTGKAVEKNEVLIEFGS